MTSPGLSRPFEELAGTIIMPQKLIEAFVADGYTFRHNLQLFKRLLSDFEEERGKNSDEHGLNHRIDLFVEDNNGDVECIKDFEWILNTVDNKLLLAAWDVDRGMYVVVLLELRHDGTWSKKPEYRNLGRILLLTAEQYEPLSSLQVLNAILG